MPIPVSLTETSTNPSFGTAPTSIRPPSGVNLIAFDSRFSTTGRRLKAFTWQRLGVCAIRRTSSVRRQPMENGFAETRRDVLRKAVFVSPLILTLPVSPSLARAGSDGGHGDHTGGGHGDHTAAGSH